MIYRFRFLVLALLLVIAVPSAAQKALTIAISKSHANDTLWLRHFDKDAKFVNIYGLSYPEAIKQVEQCDGLVMTGGEDINPAYYGQSSQRERCGNIDGYRDTLETGILSAAIKRRIPVLGICRGSQLINVVNGGSLIIDIPADVPHALRHRTDTGAEATHDVTLVRGTKLIGYISAPSGMVNSAHHQAVNTLAPGFRIGARAPDGVVESIESADTRFLLGVQWHPERLDYDNPFSSGIANAFLGAMRLSAN